MARLSRSDLEAVLDFAREVAAVAGTPDGQDSWLLPQITRLVGVEMLMYERTDAAGHTDDVTFIGAEPPPDSVELIEAVHAEGNPYSAYGARTSQPDFSATRLFDIVDRKAFRRTRQYQLMFLPDAASAQMRMAGPDQSRLVVEVLQPDGAITDRQLALLDAARPWLALYEDRRRIAREITVVLAAPLDQRAAAALTAREQQVLDRLAAGGSNQEIAGTLQISPDTVRKHLENIYAKLEVTSRTAALARTGRTTVTNGTSEVRPEP